MHRTVPIAEKNWIGSFYGADRKPHFNHAEKQLIRDFSVHKNCWCFVRKSRRDCRIRLTQRDMHE